MALFDTSESDNGFELDLGDSFIASGDELDNLYDDLVSTQIIRNMTEICNNLLVVIGICLLFLGKS